MSPRRWRTQHWTRSAMWGGVLAATVLAGCAHRNKTSAADAPTTPLTFDKDIAPILFDHCASCHRDGQAVPFTLVAYADVKKHADKITDAVKDRHMPPWLPQPGYGDFMGSRRLPDEDVAKILRWIDTGMAEGNAADLPALPTFKDGWQLGPPDLVVTLPKPYVLHPGKDDVFRNVVLPLALPSTKFVRALEFLPGNATAVIHHAVISIDRTRVSRRRSGADGQVGYDGMITQGAQSPDGHFIGWTPGRGPNVSPDGMPWRLDAGSDLVVQLHLLPSKLQHPVPVQPVVGLYFADGPPVHRPIMLKLSSKAIDIPAGDPSYEIKDSYVLPVDVDVLSVYPHAHYLGKEMQAWAVLPDGTKAWLLRINQWSFHWQTDYRYVTPVSLPRGTTIYMRYTYDNSADNEDNPHSPPVRVVYGPQSSNEMGDLWLQVLPHSDADTAVLAQAYVQREALLNIAGAEMAVRRDPNDATNQAYLGSSYADVGRTDEAVTHLQQAIALDPRLASAHTYLGGALLTKGQTAAAIAELRQAVALAPDDERMYFNLGNALNVAGHAAEAAREYQRAIAINPDFAEAHDNLGVFLLSDNQAAAAVAELERAVALAPDSPDVQNDLGAALANTGHVTDGLDHVRRALELNPNYTPAQQNLALLEKHQP